MKTEAIRTFCFIGAFAVGIYTGMKIEQSNLPPVDPKVEEECECTDSEVPVEWYLRKESGEISHVTKFGKEHPECEFKSITEWCAGIRHSWWKCERR